MTIIFLNCSLVSFDLCSRVLQLDLFPPVGISYYSGKPEIELSSLILLEINVFGIQSDQGLCLQIWGESGDRVGGHQPEIVWHITLLQEISRCIHSFSLLRIIGRFPMCNFLISSDCKLVMTITTRKKLTQAFVCKKFL